jgi:predicted nuclease of predicted toxin-antitoxin system
MLDVVEAGLQGSTDVDLLRLAAEQKRVVVTHDADFGTLAILIHTAHHSISTTSPAALNSTSRTLPFLPLPRISRFPLGSLRA